MLSARNDHIDLLRCVHRNSSSIRNCRLSTHRFRYSTWPVETLQHLVSRMYPLPVHRYIVSPPSVFLVPTDRFRQFNIDIVGPLPPCEGYRYLFTCIDRFTRWPEAFPIVNIKAETVAKTFVTGWMARFGVPEKISKDQGRQLESSVRTLENARF